MSSPPSDPRQDRSPTPQSGPQQLRALAGASCSARRGWAPPWSARRARVRWPAARRPRRGTADHLQAPVPFRGERQAGIVTEAQDRMHFATFDVTTDSRDDVIAMLPEWTQMAERMTRARRRSRTARSA